MSFLRYNLCNEIASFKGGQITMGRPLTEQKVLKKLNIENFRHLTKDKVITMASMLDKMDPEVAKKAIEQFPEFSSTAKEMLSEYKDTLDKGLESNKESVESYYFVCKSTIETLQKQLEDGELTFDERKYIIDKMLEVSKMMGEKDSENKKFVVIMSGLGLAAFGLAVAGFLQSYVLTKPRYASNISIEVSDLDNISAVVPEEPSRVYNLLESMTRSTNMKFEDYVKEISSDKVLEKTIEDLGLDDTYTVESLRSAISVTADGEEDESEAEARSMDVRIVVKDQKLGGKILVQLSENFKEHITTISQENTSETLDVIEEQMKIEKEKYSQVLKEYKRETEGAKSALELELEIEAVYEQLTEYKLSLNDLKIKEDGINGALKKGPSSQGGGMIIRPSLESGNLYLDTGKGSLEIDLAETQARIASTEKSIEDLQKDIENLKIEYQEIEFEESSIRQKVELAKESYEVFAMKHQELEMKSSMNIGGISINVLLETISEDKVIGTRKAIKIGVLTIVGFMSSIILSFVLEFVEIRKKKKLKE